MLLLHAVPRSNKTPSMMLGKVLLLIENHLLAQGAGAPKISTKRIRWYPEMRLNERENHTKIECSLNGKSREQVHLHSRSMTIQQNIRSSLFGGADIELTQVGEGCETKATRAKNGISTHWSDTWSA